MNYSNGRNDNSYVLVVFRSRQYTLRYESIFNRSGMPCNIISTPREAAIGCGLSLRVGMSNMRRLTDFCGNNRPEGLMGIYVVEPGVGRRVLKSVRMMRC